MKVPRDGPRSLCSRASVLLAVLLVLVIATLIGTTTAHRSSAEIDGTSFRLHDASARAAAWSGVLGAMVELEAQRRQLLAGGAPKLTRSITLSRPEDGVVVTAGLLDGASDSGVDPQGSLLCVNGASAEMLMASGVFAEQDAGRIAARAVERPFSSVAEVLMEAAPVAGAPVPADVGAKAGTTGGRRGATSDSGSPTESGGGAAMLTVYSFDPEVCAGAGDSERTGEARVTWESVVQAKGDAAQVARQFGADAGPGMEKVIASGGSIGSRAALIGAMRRANLGARLWGPVLDRVRFGESDCATGRINVSGANAEVLACVPGIGRDSAGALVRARERLSAEALRSLAWPVVEGVLSPDAFQAAADRLTTRSAQFRVRVEGAVAARGARASAPESAARPLARAVYDAIIDLSVEPARVAYLRDVTMEGVAEQVRRAVEARGEQTANAGQEGPGAGEEIVGSTLDVPTMRAQDDGGSRRSDVSPPPGGATVAVPGPDRAHGRVGRWTPGPRTRGDGG